MLGEIALRAGQAARALPGWEVLHTGGGMLVAAGEFPLRGRTARPPRPSGDRLEFLELGLPAGPQPTPRVRGGVCRSGPPGARLRC